MTSTTNRWNRSNANRWADWGYWGQNANRGWANGWIWDQKAQAWQKKGRNRNGNKRDDEVDADNAIADVRKAAIRELKQESTPVQLETPSTLKAAKKSGIHMRRAGHQMGTSQRNRSNSAWGKSWKGKEPKRDWKNRKNGKRTAYRSSRVL